MFNAKDIVVRNYLDEKALLVSFKNFNKKSNANWSLEQYKKSLKNQEFLNFLVFYKKNELVGIISYWFNDPWNEEKIDIEFAKNYRIKKYMIKYLENFKY